MEMTRVGPGRRAEQHGGRKHRERLHEGEAEAHREPRRQQRQIDVAELRQRTGAERRGRARQHRIDAGDVGQGQQERERKARDDERDQHAPVVVRQPDRPVVEVQELQELRQPALRAEVGQHALGDQHGAERDRHHEDRRDPALVARLACAS